MEISAKYVKQLAVELGADLVSIAAADSFGKAPQGSHPRDILPECVSVVVLACEFKKFAAF
jgi:epoxyqueuosine reductase